MIRVRPPRWIPAGAGETQINKLETGERRVDPRGGGGDSWR